MCKTWHNQIWAVFLSEHAYQGQTVYVLTKFQILIQPITIFRQFVP